MNLIILQMFWGKNLVGERRWENEWNGGRITENDDWLGKVVFKLNMKWLVNEKAIEESEG